jgi:predicted permease
MTLFRLVIIPAVLYLILNPFVSDRLLLGIIVILAGMPVAANAVLLAEEYNVDSTAASKGVFISTLLCIFTIPLTAYFLL